MKRRSSVDLLPRGHARRLLLRSLQVRSLPQPTHEGSGGQVPVEGARPQHPARGVRGDAGHGRALRVASARGPRGRHQSGRLSRGPLLRSHLRVHVGQASGLRQVGRGRTRAHHTHVHQELPRGPQDLSLFSAILQMGLRDHAAAPGALVRHVPRQAGHLHWRAYRV